MKFSIIIPVYNVENYLSDCIDSVVTQTFGDYEVILVDDGSTDTSGMLCDRYAQQYSNFFVIHQKNQGLSAARNRGVEKAQGEYLLFLDSDDYYEHSHCLEIISAVADGCDIVAFNWKETIDGKKPLNHKWKTQVDDLAISYMNGIQFLSDALRRAPLFRWYVVIYAIRKKYWLEQTFGFREGIAFEDLEITYRILLFAHGIHVVSNVFYVYRRKRRNSITSTIKAPHLLDKLDITESNIRFVQDLDFIPENLKKALCNNFAISYCSVMEYLFYIKKNEKVQLIKRLKELQWIGTYLLGSVFRSLILLAKIFGVSFVSWLLRVRRITKRI